jgi:hypothetical protein
VVPEARFSHFNSELPSEPRKAGRRKSKISGKAAKAQRFKPEDQQKVTKDTKTDKTKSAFAGVPLCELCDLLLSLFAEFLLVEKTTAGDKTKTTS